MIQKLKLIVKVERSVPRIYAKVGFIDKPISLFLLLKALGMPNDLDIIEAIF